MWVRGKLKKTSGGTFPNERVFVVSDHSGKELTFIVHEDQVREREPDDMVEVRLLEQQENLAMVRVPGEAFPDGNVITVESSKLVPA